MKTPTILIVDDEEMNVKLIKSMLLQENYNVFSAFSGQEALSVLTSITPDLILLDVMMPEMDGFELCKKIKQNENTKIVPVLMVTALTEKKHRLMAMECGADDFLSKPVEKTELKIRVKSLLRIKKYHDELYERYEEISKKNDELHELEKLRDGLLHMIVHDLKNPLFAISGNIEMLLLDKHKYSKPQITAVDNCLACCYELDKMIQQLLDIHKLENGKLKPNKRITDLTPLIEDVIKQFVKKAEAKQISITFSNTNSISSVMLDDGLIKRVVANLLDNGIRHTPTGRKVEVAAELVNNKNSLCISIKDSGNGLDPAYHQKVFNKFEQVDLNKKGVSVGTAGLGLAFCKKAVEAHDGKIWVESEGEGKGSSFLFTISIN